MVARGRMTHRCWTERQSNTGARDPFGQPVTETTHPLSGQSCYWQARNDTFVADGDKLAAIANHMMIFPLDTDVRENDVVTAVKDRRGRSLKSNRLRVIGVVRREDHVAAVLEEYH